MVRLRRVENWQAVLAAHIQEARKTPFKWGENDCLQYAARWVEKATGVDFYSPYGAYSTEEEANAIMVEAGGMIKIVKDALGSGYKDYRKAKRGDIAMVKLGRSFMGIVADDGMTISVLTSDGESRYPLRLGWRFWAV